MKKILCACFFVISLFGCTFVESPDATPTVDSGSITTESSQPSTNIPTTASQILILTSTIQPSQTAAPTSTPIVTPTPTDVPVQLIRQCPVLTTTLPTDGSYTGRILVEGWQSQLPSEYLLDLSTGQRVDFPDIAPDEEILLGGISPDHRWLAYTIGRVQDGFIVERTLVIADSNLRTQRIIPFQKPGIFPDGWVDSQFIGLEIQREDPYHADLSVVDAFTGEERYTTNGVVYPNIDTSFPSIWGFDLIPLEFASTLKHLLYGTTGFGMTIWDMTEERALFTVNNGTYRAPSWSLDGQLVAMPRDFSRYPGNMDTQELYLISLSGDIQRLTYLTTQYEKVALSDVSWSSNQRYLAFGFDTPDYEAPTDYPPLEEKSYILAIFDLERSELRDLCIPFYGSMPLWLPDDNFLLVEAADSTYLNPRMYLIDLRYNLAIQIDGYTLKLYGWLANTP